MKKGVAIGLAIIALLIVASYVFFSSSGNEPKDLVSDDVTITGKVTLTQRPLTLSELASGVSLDAYSNQIIWSDELSENLSINDAFGSILDNVLFVYDYTFQTYWFNPQGSYASYNNHSYYSQRLYDSIVPGHQYFIYMVKDDVLMYTVCSDSDGGKNYYVKGSVTGVGSGGPYSDYCLYNDVLIERYCNSDSPNRFTEEYNCASEGLYCQNGACVENYTKPSESEIPDNQLPIQNCHAQSFSWSASVDGDHLCWENTRDYCLFSKVSMTVFNTTSEEIIGSGFSRFMSCEEDFADFDESAEINNRNLGLRAMTEFEVLCCSAPANECTVDADCAPEEAYYCSSDGAKACLSTATKDWQCVNNQCSTTIVQEDAGCTVCQNGCSDGACVSENWVPVDLSVVRIDPQDSELKIGDQVIEYTIYQGEIESVSVPYYDSFNFSVKTIDLYSNSGSGSLIFGDANVLSIKSSGYSIEVAGSKVYEVFLHYDGSHIDLYTRDTDGDFTPVGRVRLEYNDASSASVGILKLLI